MNLSPPVKLIIITIAIIITAVLLSVFELYTQLARYASYWQKNNSKPAVAGEVLYVALGDSTAQGIGATSPKKGYVSLVANGISHKENKSVRTVNLSKSGAKVNDVVSTQLPALKRLPVNDNTYVTIEIGANDMSSFDAKRFETEMDEVMQQLPRQALITNIPYFGDSRHSNRQPDVEAANKIMDKLATKNNFKLLDLHKRMQENGGFKTLAADMFHPSNTAYRENWAYVFLQRINSDPS